MSLDVLLEVAGWAAIALVVAFVVACLWWLRWGHFKVWP